MAMPILYSFDLSPSARSVLLTAKAIGLDLDLKLVDLTSHEQLTEEFKKINPQHTFPTLQDTDGTILWDSHAISTYLIAKYAKDDSLYPTDLVIRAKVDQRLHFNSGILLPRARGALEPILFFKRVEVPQEKKDAIVQAYNHLETFLQNDDYLVGNKLTVADLCAITSVLALDIIVKIDSIKYPKITKWIDRLEKLPYSGINKDGNERLRDVYLFKVNSKTSLFENN